MRPFRSLNVARPPLLALVVLVLLVIPAAARPHRPGVGAQTHPGGQGAIAFESDRTGNPEIWRMDVDGSDLTQLTNDPSSDDEPAWSASGTQLAFVSLRDGNAEIYRMTATGAGIKQLTTTDVFVSNSEPAWFPSDLRVVYTSARQDTSGSDLWAQDVDVNGNPVGQPVQLTTNSAFDREASVSPDGKTIVFASNRKSPQNPTGDLEIFVMQANAPEGPNNKPQQLTNNDRADQSPDWSPNGKKIAFASDRTAPGEFLIYTMTNQGQQEQPVSPAGHLATNPTWSPDGKRLAYTGGDFTEDILRINANGRQLTNLTGDSAGGNESPAWQPR